MIDFIPLRKKGQVKNKKNRQIEKEAGSARRTLLPLLKISLGNPYLKILDLTKLFIADAPMKKKIIKFSFTPSQCILKYGSKNRPWPKGLRDLQAKFQDLTYKALTKLTKL